MLARDELGISCPSGATWSKQHLGLDEPLVPRRQLGQHQVNLGDGVASTADGDPVEGLRLLGALPYGGVWVLEQSWRELGIDSVIKKVAGERSGAANERALFAMVANCALEPYSKLYRWEQWLHEEVFLPSVAELSLSRL